MPRRVAGFFYAPVGLRRTMFFMKNIRILLPIICLSLLAFAVHADKPNILLIMADDQGWGDTAYNGHAILKTPNLDAMAEAGLRMDRFYAAAPVCTPTRASVMTGRHPNRMGAFKWGHTLRPQEITIAEALKTAGYKTGHFGKWHLGSVRKGSPVNPGNSGFDAWLSAPNFYDNDPIMSQQGVAVVIKGESSIVAAEAAIEFMKESAGKQEPFLAVVWFGSPHVPHRAAAEDLAHYEGQKNPHWLGEITGIDRAVGKLRASLKEIGVAENTLVWYTSDNGGLYTESSGGRAKKGSVYEGGLRVPCIIEWPSQIKTPRTSEYVSCTSDIYPTLLSIVGLEIDNQPPLDGESLLPLINGKADSPQRPIGFWQYPGGGVRTPSAEWMKALMDAQQAGNEPDDPAKLRLDAGKIKKQYPIDRFPGQSAWLSDPWKLHRFERNDGKVKWELYNLAKDPMEASPIDDAIRIATMKAELEDWLTSVVNSLNGEDYPAE